MNIDRFPDRLQEQRFGDNATFVSTTPNVPLVLIDQIAPRYFEAPPNFVAPDGGFPTSVGLLLSVGIHHGGWECGHRWIECGDFEVCECIIEAKCGHCNSVRCYLWAILGPRFEHRICRNCQRVFRVRPILNRTENLWWYRASFDASTVLIRPRRTA